MLKPRIANLEVRRGRDYGGSVLIPLSLHPDTVKFGTEAYFSTFGRDPRNDDEILIGAMIWLEEREESR